MKTLEEIINADLTDYHLFLISRSAKTDEIMEMSEQQAIEAVESIYDDLEQ